MQQSQGPVVLVELGLVKQRYKAVLDIVDGAAAVTDVARRRPQKLVAQMGEAAMIHG